MPTALRTFIDPDDPVVIYHPGDAYPRPGYTPAGDRLADLAKGPNALITPPEPAPGAQKPPARRGKISK